MKITREKKTIWVEAMNKWDFDAQLNESMEGLIDATVQVYGLYQAAILYTEITVQDEDKTIADLFEEAGCGARCGECPFYAKPTDKRIKWSVCGKRKINEGSRACDDYYLGRRKNAKAG